MAIDDPVLRELMRNRVEEEAARTATGSEGLANRARNAQRNQSQESSNEFFRPSGDPFEYRFVDENTLEFRGQGRSGTVDISRVAENNPEFLQQVAVQDAFQNQFGTSMEQPAPEEPEVSVNVPEEETTERTDVNLRRAIMNRQRNTNQRQETSVVGGGVEEMARDAAQTARRNNPRREGEGRVRSLPEANATPNQASALGASRMRAEQAAQNIRSGNTRNTTGNPLRNAVAGFFGMDPTSDDSFLFNQMGLPRHQQ